MNLLTIFIIHKGMGNIDDLKLKLSKWWLKYFLSKLFSPLNL